MNEDIDPEEELDEGLDKLTFDRIKHQHSSVSSSHEEFPIQEMQEDDESRIEQPTHPPSHMSRVFYPQSRNDTRNVSQ